MHASGETCKNFGAPLASLVLRVFRDACILLSVLSFVEIRDFSHFGMTPNKIFQSDFVVVVVVVVVF